MIPKFRFWLDNTLVQDPKGWENIDTTIKRSYDIATLLQSQTYNPEFFGNGYALIKNKFDAFGFCDTVLVRIDETVDQVNYEQIFTGVIFLSDCVFDLERCSVKVKTNDGSFWSKIDNNKSIKTKLTAPRSKNNVDIDPCPNIVMYKTIVATGTTRGWCYAYRFFDVIKYLIDFMTDGTVGFVSDDFGRGGKWEGVAITVGIEIREGQVMTSIEHDDAVPSQINWTDAITEINKKLKIGMAVEYIDGKPFLRLEGSERFFEQSSAVTLENAKSVVMQMDTTHLYSQVHVGSSVTDNDPPSGAEGIPHFPEDISFLGFKDETFNTVGICNIDKTLELSSTWIISSNVIEDIDRNNNDSHDNEIVLVHLEYDSGNIWNSVKTNWLSPSSAVKYYNELFSSKNTVERWLDGIPNSIAKFLGDGNDEFMATQTVIGSIYTTGNGTGDNIDDITIPVICQNDYTLPNYDPNNRYGVAIAQGSDIITFANAKYTVGNAGIYSFRYTTPFEVINIFSANRKILIHKGGSGGALGSYRDTITSADGSTAKFLCADESDPANVWLYINENSVYGWTGNISFASTGFWSFGSPLSNLALSLPPLIGHASVHIRQYDSTHTTFINEIIGSLTPITGLGGGYVVSAEGSLICSSNDLIEVYVYMHSEECWIEYSGRPKIGGSFSCTATANGGGIKATIDPANFKLKQYSFTYPMTYAQFKAVKNNQKKLITFTTNNGVVQTGFIDEFKYYHHNKDASIRLISK